MDAVITLDVDILERLELMNDIKWMKLANRS